MHLFHLCGFSEVTSYNPAEFSFTSNLAFKLRHERPIEHFAIHTDSAVRPLGVVMFDPDAIDVVELLSAKTNEVVETFSLQRPYE